MENKGKYILAARWQVLAYFQRMSRKISKALPIPQEIAVAPVTFRDRWQAKHPIEKITWSFVSGSFLLTMFTWCVSQFYQIRGVQHMLTSRIFLIGACITAVAACWCLTWVFFYDKRLRIFAICLAFFIVVGVGMDRLYPMPEIEGTRNSSNKGPGVATYQWDGFKEIPNSVDISLGSMDTVMTMSDLRKWGQLIPFRFFGITPVIVTPTKEGGYSFAFNTYGVHITDSQVTIDNPTVERQVSNNALEIVDSSGAVVFQVIRKNASHIAIYGIFGTSQIDQQTHRPMSMWEDQKGGIDLSVDPPVGFNLKPIFRYPSWKYPGQYADDQNGK
jgi:hypothetical protein